MVFHNSEQLIVKFVQGKNHNPDSHSGWINVCLKNDQTVSTLKGPEEL